MLYFQFLNVCNIDQQMIRHEEGI